MRPKLTVALPTGLAALWLPVVLGLLLACSDEHAPVFDGSAVIAKARSLHGAIRSANANLLWAELDRSARETFGTVESFGESLETVLAETGQLRSCLYDLATREGEYWLYRGDCEFTESRAPLLVVLTFKDDGRVAGMWIGPGPEAYPTEHLAYETRTPLKLPFQGEWTVAWGGRTALLNIHAEHRDQRFAYDFFMARDGATHGGAGRRNSDYYCFGTPVLAPAAATVVLAIDGVADNRPGIKNAREPLGNAVVLDHGQGEFSMMAHFKRGSLRVDVGQRVSEGETLGLCGNSGNSNEPHLHYNLQSGAQPLEADGLPAAFLDYVADGRPVVRGEPLRGQRIRRENAASQM